MPDSPPLRVAHIDAETRFSGGEVQVFLLMEGLRARGHDNILICPAGSAAEAEAKRRGIETRAVRLRNHLSLFAVHKLRRLLRDLEVDLVQTNTGRDAWLGGWSAWRAGLPSVTTRRMDRVVRPGLRTRLTYTTFADRVVAISPGVMDCLEAADVPRSQIVLIPEAVDAERIRPLEGREKTRAALGVEGDAVLVLGLGALLPRKGFDVLIDALALLPEALRERIEVRVGGEGASQTDLEAQANAVGLASKVRFLGRRSDTGDLLAAADLFAMPSRAEGLGVAALEAMGAGVPVIASEVGGLAFSVVDDLTGLHVPPNDPAAFSAALQRLVHDAGLRHSMGQAARARVKERFLPDTMVEAYIALYRDVLRARAALA